MKEHNIKLTAAEIGTLWSNYMQESSTIPMLKYFSKKVEDSEIKPLIDKVLKISMEHLDKLESFFKQENFPVPVGFSEKDVNLDAPRLFSDTFMLYFIRNMGKAGIAAHGMSFSFTAREDIRELFLKCLQEATEIEDEAKNIMLSKGVFVRPPYLSSPQSVSFVEKESFLRGWFGERRTLTAEEISHIFMNYQNNIYGRALLIGFSQIAQDKKVKEYFLRGIDLAGNILETLKLLFEESSLPSPMTWDTEVTDSTTYVFSDKLMLFNSTALNAISLGNMGGSVALSMRRDLSTKYLNKMAKIGLYAEDGLELMINNRWFERPPQAIDRAHLVENN
ncbi:DUF3231 family protein [Bacillus suaedae]|uniref:DUF3231 family protein n=1 Tax=Halalkalibacter suaedae TaxID=2822140 RepID=A0A940WSV4_9BACI|nr:DUF3231 family protein [Bacillus suaedae]MBP3949563.1 DUF3231 family protein [Bacillus suaedae]